MNTYVNLLPLPYRRKQLIARCLRAWLTVWSLAALIIAGLAWSEWSRYREGTARLEELREQYAPLQAMQTENDNLRTRIRELRQRENVVLSLADEQSMLSVIGLLSRAARACDGRVGIRKMNLQRNEVDSQNAQRLLTLEGVATDNEAVAGFAESLRGSPAFRSVELKSAGTARTSQMPEATAAPWYRLDCVF